MAKTKRNFNLEKGGRRYFELGKDGDEPMVDSKTTQAAQPTAQVENTPDPKVNKETVESGFNPVPGWKPEPPKKRTWLIVAIAVAIAGAVIAFCSLYDCAGNKEEGAEAPKTDTVATAEESNDTAAAAEEAADTTSAAAETPEAALAESPASATPSAEAVPAATSPQPAAADAQPVSSLSGDFEQDVLNTIRGKFGNGRARKSALGDRYRDIQREVNRRMR